MNIAVFIDLENISSPNSIDTLMDHLLISGNVLVRRAYGNIRKQAPTATLERLHRYSFITFHVPSGKSGKNASDIHMSLDAFECVIEKPHIHVLAIATGDSDFSPLIFKCRERNINVWGFGLRGNTAGSLMDHVDKFYYLDHEEKVVRGKLSDRELVLNIIDHLIVATGKDNLTQTHVQNAIQRIIPNWKLPPDHKSMRSYLKTNLKNSTFSMDKDGIIVSSI